MKISILLKIKEGPFGGSHQFLRTLRSYLIEKGIYEENVAYSDVVMFDSHAEAHRVLQAKLRHKNKIFIHRIDGPIRLYNDENDIRDHIVNLLNNKVADGTIFQSNWSRNNNYALGLGKNVYETVIMNAADGHVYNLNNKVDFTDGRRMQLVAVSWSPNWKKGFNTYKWLDDNLDFSRYQMTFIGNSPIKFKNIRMIPAIGSEEIASQLKQSDIFISASQKDPCSNALIEAMSCGLPAITLNDGGHPEIVQMGGEMFNTTDEIPAILEKIRLHYKEYVNKIRVRKIKDVGDSYVKFASKIRDKMMHGDYRCKQISYVDFVLSACQINMYRLKRHFL